MAVVVIDTIKPKNQGTFPVVEAADVKVTNDKRLDTALNEKANASTVEALSTAVAGKASQSDLTALSNTVADKADKTALAETNTAVAGKQGALTEEQLAACNSGITSTLVTQIGTNTTAIAGKASQADLSALQETVSGKADTSDLTTLEAEVDTKADVTTTTSLQAQIDAIVTPVSQTAEVENARVDANGISHVNLKARIDSTEKDIQNIGAFYIDNNETFYRGNIDTSTGEVDANTKRIYTDNFISVSDVQEIQILNGASFGLRFYAYDGTYLGYTGWSAVPQRIDEANTFGGAKFKIVVKNSTDTTVDDVAALSSCVRIVCYYKIDTISSNVATLGGRVTDLETAVQGNTSNIATLTTDVNILKYVLKDELSPEWIRGTIDTATGEYDGNTKRVCTNEFIRYNPTYNIHLENGVYFGLRFYDANKRYLDYTNFQNTDSSIVALAVPNNTEYIKIVARNSTNTTIEHTSDVSDYVHITEYCDVPQMQSDIESNIATLTTDVNILKYVLKDELSPEWIRGTIDTATGEYDGNTKRVCTNEFIRYNPTYNIHLENGVYFGLRFYDANKRYLDYTNFQNTDSSIVALAVPNNTEYIKIVARNSTNTTIEHTSDVSDYVHITEYCDVPQMQSDIESNTDRIEALESGSHNNKRFCASYEATELPVSLTQFNTNRLSLVATKKINYYNADNLPIVEPYDAGYLYLDCDTDKFYYSATVWDEPEYLFTWDRSITPDNSNANKWCPIITKDGDIIFVMQGKETNRKNPIVYPHDDMAHPVVVDLASSYEYTTAGLTTDTGACVSCYDNFVLFGEYRENKGGGAYNGEPIRIWKITAPYKNVANWSVKLTKYHSDSEVPWGQDPTNEVAHFHTVSFDHYTGYYYANTGDADTSCRIFVSKDKGENWTEVINNGQQWRGLGYVYTSDGVYWGTDSANWEYHNLYFAGRDANGEIDFTQTTVLANCRHESGQLQRTYNTCLCHNPEGILLLDRAETRTDGILNLEFYSFDDETLHLVDVLHATEYDATTGRYGFGNFATTYYQNTNADGIICGGMLYDRKMSLDILRNTREHRVGNTKITIHQMW